MTVADPKFVDELMAAMTAGHPPFALVESRIRPALEGLADKIETHIGDPLAQLIWHHEFADGPGISVRDARRLAEAITAAGFRPPLPKITTVEELATLPCGTIIFETCWAGWETDPIPHAWLRIDTEDDGLQWLDFGDTQEYGDAQIDLPAVVLWQPRGAG